MAVTRNDAAIQSFVPKWPDLSELSAERIVLAYDVPSDTLFVDFCDEAKPAASLALDLGELDYYYLRVDAETEEVVGLQIEHFRSYAVPQHPWLAHALDVATLEGVTPSRMETLDHPEPETGSWRVARRQLVLDLVRLGR